MPEGRAAIAFEHVVKAYRPGEPAVDDVSLEIPAGTFAVLVGPSGSGKTTLMKTVNRLFDVSSGRVFVDGADVSSIDPVALRRRIGYVIQQVGLFAHMTVAENIAVVPSLLAWDTARTSARVDELLALVHLEPARYRERYPAQLSGGEAQRVGLARALAADPQILLMDEPFGAIDAIERARLQGELAELQSRLRKTILFVTHDVEEALRLADLLIVMRAGRIEQSGTPLEVITGPANVFVAALLDADDVLRRLSLMPVSGALIAGTAATVPASGHRIGVDRDLRTALSLMIAGNAASLLVVDRAGAPAGVLTLADIQRAARPAVPGT
jgi:osmoprotectant transport system ATP-binding protein